MWGGVPTLLVRSLPLPPSSTFSQDLARVTKRAARKGSSGILSGTRPTFQHGGRNVAPVFATAVFATTGIG